MQRIECQDLYGILYPKVKANVKNISPFNWLNRKNVGLDFHNVAKRTVE